MLQSAYRRSGTGSARLWSVCEQDFYYLFGREALAIRIGEVLPLVTKHVEEVSLQLRVFTNRPCTAAESAGYVHQVASELSKPDDYVKLAIIEIPTASNEFLRPSGRETPQSEEWIEANPQQTTARFQAAMESVLVTVRFPEAFPLLDWRCEAGRTDSLTVELTCLGKRETHPDARALLAAEIRLRIGGDSVGVHFDRVDARETLVRFRRGEITSRSAAALDQVGQVLAHRFHPGGCRRRCSPGQWCDTRVVDKRLVEFS